MAVPVALPKGESVRDPVFRNAKEVRRSDVPFAVDKRIDPFDHSLTWVTSDAAHGQFTVVCEAPDTRTWLFSDEETAVMFKLRFG